ncbi:MAG: hypothetical protein M1834_006984 [Cirrosporium novae-zelandiae]|nr:MAG: hypothetical protein M1834_006984 [Cirrosporium novae-zelandiae]
MEPWETKDVTQSFVELLSPVIDVIKEKSDIVQYLQDQIAAKELQLRARGIDPDSRVRTENREVTHQVRDAPKEGSRGNDLVMALATSCTETMSSSAIRSEPAFPSGLFLLSPSSLPQLQPSKEETDDSIINYTISRGLGVNTKDYTTPPHAIPLHIAGLLTKNYVDKILPQYPIFDAQTVWDGFNTVYHAKDHPQVSGSDLTKFMVSMVLCISIMTSRASDISKVASTSDQMFRSALQCLDCLRCTSLGALQACLLLIQYSYLRPTAGNLWNLVGLAMRMAIELGLHQDISAENRIADDLDHKFDARLRRRIFWVTYEMDRSICATSFRRFGIEDNMIKVQLLSEQDITYAEPTNQFPSRPSENHFLNVLHFRRLQSEVYTVNFTYKSALDFPGDYESWLQDIEDRIRAWQNNIASRDRVGPEWFDCAVFHGLVFLHRPCPRNPFPSKASLTKCFDAATRTAASYLDHAHSGFLKYSWHAVHHGFEAAICMLYAVRHCQFELREMYGIRKILEALHLFSTLFALISEVWGAAARCGEIYERLKASVLKELTSAADTTDVSKAHDELDRLVLPSEVWRGKSRRNTIIAAQVTASSTSSSSTYSSPSNIFGSLLDGNTNNGNNGNAAAAAGIVTQLNTTTNNNFSIYPGTTNKGVSQPPDHRNHKDENIDTSSSNAWDIVLAEYGNIDWTDIGTKQVDFDDMLWWSV